MIALTKGRSFVFQLLAVGTLFVFMWTFLLPHEAIAAREVRIPAGTVVILQTITTLTPEELRVGDTVDLMVVSDVFVDEKIAIGAGAKANGEITISRERNFIGIAGKIGLTIKSVQAVDGTMVLLSGRKISEGKDKMVMSIGLSLVCCILFALMKGGEVSLETDMQIEATVPVMTSVMIQ